LKVRRLLFFMLLYAAGLAAMAAGALALRFVISL
jgi:hypothetical protein